MSQSNPSAEALLEGLSPMTDPEDARAPLGPSPAEGEGSPPETCAEEALQAAEEPTEEPAAAGPGEALTDEELVRAVSALVFASPEPLGSTRLCNLLEGPRPARVAEALLEIGRRLEASGLPLELCQIAGGWRLMTSPDVSPAVSQLVKARKADKLSPAGLETLAVVAYRQPVTKAEIEAIRGVQCGPMLRNLVDRGLARVTGRADLPGAPLQYGTTKEFLDRFGMASLGDLPRDGELLKE
jgi:segregation and condensation protein B